MPIATFPMPRLPCARLCRPRAMRGQAALVLMMTLCTATLALLPAVLPSPQQAAERRTRAALAEARAALLGYAAAYPDRVNAAFGPGYLPCPARDARGIAAPACARATGSTRGRFPWHTLRTNDLRDGSGAPLWYAISESHRYNPKQEPLNGTTALALTVDERAAVAVIIAPGAAQAGQQRDAVDAPVADYLDGVNGAEPPDTFSSRAGNDRLAVLDAGTMAGVAASRAMGELAVALRAYAAAHGNHYPWLAPLGDPDGRPRAAAGPGWLPVHYFDGTSPRPYTATVTPRWQLADAAVRGDVASPLFGTGCIARMPCRGVDGGAIAVNAAAACTWGEVDSARPPREQLQCVLSAGAEVDGVHYQWAIETRLDDADGVVPVSGPDDLAPRRRAIEARAFAPRGTRATLAIALRATRGDEQAEILVEGTATTSGWFAVDDLRYDLDVNAGELPSWVVRNGWHRQVVVATAPCRGVHDCLEVVQYDAAGTPRGQRRARAVLLGPGLPPAGITPGAMPDAAWFEGTNRAVVASGTGTFARGPARDGFDDRVRMVEAAP